MKGDTHSVQCYGILLMLYPKQYRERFGEEMLEVFRQCDEEACRVPGGHLRLWLHVLLELPSTITYEYLKRKEYMDRDVKYMATAASLLLAPFFLLIAGAVAGSALGLPVNYQIGQAFATYHLVTPVMRVFPAIAGVLALASLGRQVQLAGGVSSAGFGTIKRSWPIVGLLLLSLFALLVLPFHDSGPCVKRFATHPNVGQLETCVRTS